MGDFEGIWTRGRFCRRRSRWGSISCVRGRRLVLGGLILGFVRGQWLILELRRVRPEQYQSVSLLGI
jgi:hypothetical protein